jgi:DNA-binding response OmpR family regulator
VEHSANGANGDAARARLLLLYARPAQAVALVQRLPSERYDIVTSQAFSRSAGWIDELRPDVVLLSPPPDAEELVASCEAARAETDRPLVVLSELADELTITRSLAAGIDDYFVLPIGDRELVARIEAMLRRLQRNPAVDETRRVGELTLSSHDHSVTRNGQKIVLSPIEFRLLACLASAPGKVLTHQTLMSRVWGAEYVDSRHYLRVYVRYLREKLEDDPNRPQLILSEWGVGYRLHVAERGATLDPTRALRVAPAFGTT